MLPALRKHGIEVKDKVAAEIVESDCEAYFTALQKMDYTYKTIAIFGLGDQLDSVRGGMHKTENCELRNFLADQR